MTRPSKLIVRTLMIDVLMNSVRSRLNGRSLQARARKTASDVRARLEDIKQRWPEEVGTSTARPIFIFAAGWRSGSTLLQRMLSSAEDIMIWGEAYSRSQITSTLLKQFRPVTSDWPKEHYVADAFDGDLDDQWIANIYPAFRHLVRAHRIFFTELFETPAQEMGRSRWGFKEVRLFSEHAFYLKFLFPEAKFIFLYRDPVQSYLSFRQRYHADFIAWPDQPIASAGEFGAMWSEMLTDFLDNYQAVDGLLLKYEDLLSDPAAHQRLCDYVGTQVPAAESFAVIEGRYDRRDSAAPPTRTVPRGELFMLKRNVGKLRGKLGYA